MSFPLSMPIAGPLSYPIAQYEGVGVPAGFILLVDADGHYLIDSDGYYLMEAI